VQEKPRPEGVTLSGNNPYDMEIVAYFRTVFYRCTQYRKCGSMIPIWGYRCWTCSINKLL